MMKNQGYCTSNKGYRGWVEGWELKDAWVSKVRSMPTSHDTYRKGRVQMEEGGTGGRLRQQMMSRAYYALCNEDLLSCMGRALAQCLKGMDHQVLCVRVGGSGSRSVGARSVEGSPRHAQQPSAAPEAPSG